MQASNHRSLLIAINAHPKLPRGSVCRLAQSLDKWTEPDEGLDRMARKIGVSSRSLGTALASAPDAENLAQTEEDRAAALGISITTILDSTYPRALLDTPLPPPVLYVLGSLPDRSAVAIVGSRRPDAYGREAAHFFGHQLALRGVTVVSGFARGIDVAAHRGALSCAGGTTVAVLGCGIDFPYPSHHPHLLEPIRRAGAVLSEFPLGTHPQARNFPVRNRIIAALAQSTLVIQAAPRSGSLITARYAMEMNRDIYALPGRIFDTTALGPNALLRDGAGIALHPDDLLGATAPGPGNDSESSPPLPGPLLDLWKQIPRTDSVLPEILGRMLDRRIDTVLSQLLELELGGWVLRHPGGSYTRRGR